MEEHHRRIAEIALSAAGKFSLALAGGYAIQAHGIGSRPSGDVDLFVNWARRDDFDAAVIAALAAEGLQADVIVRAETFARLLVADPTREGKPDKVEIAADWRSHDPVTLDIGLVLDAGDAVANEMGALYGRAPARDFLGRGRHTHQRPLHAGAPARTRGRSGSGL